MPVAKQKPVKRWLVSTHELTDVLGISRQRLTQYVNSGLPKAGHGSYELKLVFAWLRERWQDRSGGKPLDLARQREAEVRTQKHHLELETIRGNLIRTTDAQELLGAVATAVSAEFQNVAGRVPAEPKVRVLITDECRAAAGRVAAVARECAESLRRRGQSLLATDSTTETDGG